MLHRCLNLVAAILLSTPTTAQVVITEVLPSEGWIELHNRGTTAQPLGSWSLYVTAPTTVLPGNYWWPFPATASIGPGEFAVVHWNSSFRTPAAGEFWTGTSHGRFLFGLGSQSLSTLSGSIALLSTQRGDFVSDPRHQVDYMAWGRGGQERENIAILAGLWNPGTFVTPPINTSASIALGTNPTIEPTPATDYYLDSTPSPMRGNQAGASVEHYGHDCAVGATNAPTLEVRGVPAIGNPDFVLRSYGTDAVIGQTLVLILGFGRGHGATLPLPQFTCPLWVDPTQLTFTVLIPAARGQAYTDLPLSLEHVDPGLTGVTLHVQAALGVLPFSAFDHASSGGVAITLGG